MGEDNEGGVRVERTVRAQMVCEHGVSIYDDCCACNHLYTSMEQHWETKQIRKELASVDLRLVQLARERERFRREVNAWRERYPNYYFRSADDCIDLREP
jgi:hypothetical protein